MPVVLEVDSISLGDDPAVRFRVIDRAADIDFVISIKAPNAIRGSIEVVSRRVV